MIASASDRNDQQWSFVVSMPNPFNRMKVSGYVVGFDSCHLRTIFTAFSAFL